jgi:hypothetical protein
MPMQHFTRCSFVARRSGVQRFAQRRWKDRFWDANFKLLPLFRDNLHLTQANLLQGKRRPKLVHLTLALAGC